MNWLLPTQPPAVKGRVRTVGAPDRKVRLAANQGRYRAGPSALANREKTLELRRAYHRAWHQKHLERRRAYLAMKARERRAARRAA